MVAQLLQRPLLHSPPHTHHSTVSTPHPPHRRTCTPSSMAPLSAALKMRFCPKLRAESDCCVSIAARSYLRRHSSYLIAEGRERESRVAAGWLLRAGRHPAGVRARTWKQHGANPARQRMSRDGGCCPSPSPALLVLLVAKVLDGFIVDQRVNRPAEEEAKRVHRNGGQTCSAQPCTSARGHSSHSWVHHPSTRSHTGCWPRSPLGSCRAGSAYATATGGGHSFRERGER